MSGTENGFSMKKNGKAEHTEKKTRRAKKAERERERERCSYLFREIMLLLQYLSR